MLVHLGGYIGAISAVVLAIYIETHARCQFFPFFSVTRAQSHVKTTVFAHRRHKIRGRRRARNTVKHEVFERAAAPITFGYQPKASGDATGSVAGARILRLMPVSRAPAKNWADAVLVLALGLLLHFFFVCLFLFFIPILFRLLLLLLLLLVFVFFVCFFVFVFFHVRTCLGPMLGPCWPM